VSAATVRGRRPRWGQNFLVDGNVARHIVEWADVEGRAVLEIGPGRGALTEMLAERAAQLTLVEIDPGLAAQWSERFAGDPRVTVVQGDALELDLASLRASPTHVVANLPYESGTAIVRRLLQPPVRIDAAVVMLQREVCQRLLAREGSSHYGLLAIHTRLAAEVEAGRVVGPSCFRPQPRVSSQLVRLKVLAEPRFDVGDRALFDELVGTAFGQRRKMIRNTVGRWIAARVGEERSAQLLGGAGLDDTTRPQDVSLAQFAGLARALHEESRHRARAT
jgi:16S rRNA (adenine1518-N6/adenine1519-N6)-dimethyltransferase